MLCLILYFHFSHLVSFSLRTVPNFTLNSAACNRLHAFVCSVRVGCLISACNICVILVRTLDIFIHFCPILYMLDCGKYFPPRATLFPGLNFILSLFASPEMIVRELQNQLLELKRTYASNSVGAALFLSSNKSLLSLPRCFDPYKALAGLESVSRFGTGKCRRHDQTFQHNSTPMPPPPGQAAVPKNFIKVGRRQRRC